MASKVTQRSAELAERRARRAELEEKAEIARRKANRASKRSVKLKYVAQEKRYLAEAQSIRLRRRSSGSTTGKSRSKSKNGGVGSLLAKLGGG